MRPSVQSSAFSVPRLRTQHKARKTLQPVDFYLDLLLLPGYFRTLFSNVISGRTENRFCGAKNGTSQRAKSREEITLSLARPVRLESEAKTSLAPSGPHLQQR